jgi:hypothetical protein
LLLVSVKFKKYPRAPCDSATASLTKEIKSPIGGIAPAGGPTVLIVIEAGVTTPVAGFVTLCLTILITVPPNVGAPDTAGGTEGATKYTASPILKMLPISCNPNSITNVVQGPTTLVHVPIPLVDLSLKSKVPAFSLKNVNHSPSF